MSFLTLRVVTFQALGPDSAVDATLRSDLLPQLLAEPDVVDAWQGRRGTGDGSRALVSTWREPWMAAGGEAPDVRLLRTPALAAICAIEIAAVEQLEIAVHARFTRVEPARVLRIFHGTTRPSELIPYVDEARAGMTADSQINDGLVSFVLGHDGVDRFVSASTWTGWPAIEAATGGNTRHPFATRNARRLTDYRIVHLELLPEAPMKAVPLRVEALEPAS